MYENIYAYNEECNGKSVWMLFKPNFREAIELFNGERNIFSDGEIKYVGNLVLDGTRCQFPHVFISENAQWGLTDEGYGYIVYVTERTQKIETPLGDKWNNEFNRILKKCKNDYFKKKKEEVRLYFYEAGKDKLSLCYLGASYERHENYQYSLYRYFSPKCVIDKRYLKPDKDCFILGRIRKTIGLKNSKLLDFIEPVHEIPLDFEKDEWDFGEYQESISDLENILFKLIKFTITKEHVQLEIKRIRKYFELDNKKSDMYVTKSLYVKIMDGFSTGNVNELRKLYNVLITPQDCTNVKFELRLKEETTCAPDKKFDIYFLNGEYGYVSAKWIYENIDDCTDASGVYLGNITNRYNFY